MSAYEKFAEYVLGDGIRSRESFIEICRRIDVSPSEVDGVMLEELGMGGEEFLFSCRKYL